MSRQHETSPGGGRLAWKLYDGSNSIVHLIVITIMMPWAFDAYWEQIRADDPIAAWLGGSGDKAWGIVATLSLIVAGITSYFIGRAADAKRRLAVWFKLSAILSVLMVVGCAMYFAGVTRHLVAPAAGLLVVFTLSLFLYDAMLIDAANGQDADTLATTSGSGWAIGYLVSAAILAAMWGMSMFPARPEYPQITKIFVIALFFFGTMTIFILRFWPDELGAAAGATSAPPKTEKSVWPFLIACFLLTDAVVTIAYFVTLISKNVFGLALGEIVMQFLAFHIIAIPATWLATPWLIARPTMRQTCLLMAFAWLFVCAGGSILLFLDLKQAALWFLVLGMGVLIGTTPATIRALYAKVIPVNQRGEYFSYAVITQRTFAFVGPAVATAILMKTGNYLLVLVSPIPLLLFAVVLFWRIDFNQLRTSGSPNEP